MWIETLSATQSTKTNHIMNVNEQARKALSMIDAFIVQYKKDLNEIGQIPTLQGFKAEMYARVRIMGFPVPLAVVMIDRYAKLNG